MMRAWLMIERERGHRLSTWLAAWDIWEASRPIINPRDGK
jgi:hypothetical protein